MSSTTHHKSSLVVVVYLRWIDDHTVYGIFINILGKTRIGEM